MSYNIEQANSGFLSLTAAGLIEGTNSGTFKTVNTLTFTNNGVFKSLAATDNAGWPDQGRHQLVGHVHTWHHRPVRNGHHRHVLRLHGHAWLSPVSCHLSSP